MKPDQIDQTVWNNLPEAPGVYRFWGPDDELLYIGKSKQIRDRVRSHFNPGNDTYKHERLHAETHEITTEITAGNLSASLLELHEIKTRQPLLNKRSRKKKQLVVAEKQTDEGGFFYPELSRVKNIETLQNKVLGVFRSHKQATSIIESLAREYELCRRKLQISTAGQNGRACFYYQLGQCRGACVGGEDKELYNKRFRKAFADYAVRAWPFDGSVALVENGDQRTDVFVMDTWCLQKAVTKTESGLANFFADDSVLDRFYYDVYKCLANAVLSSDKKNIHIEKNPNEYIPN